MGLILIVDSDLDFTTELAAGLAHDGHRALRASCPSHALALLSLGTPDLAVLDAGQRRAPDAVRLCATLIERGVPQLLAVPDKAEGFGQAPAASTLRKPFGAAEVAAKLPAGAARAAAA